MTLDEAIKHAEEVAEEQERNTGWFYDKENASYKKKCNKCAEEHRQLAEWLKDYQQILKERHFDDAKKHFDAIYKLAQTTGMTYSFIEACIEEAETALLEASPQPCDDCISREETLKTLMDEQTEYDLELIDSLIEKIKKLPPVTPQPKMGRWVLKKRYRRKNIRGLF